MNSPSERRILIVGHDESTHQELRQVLQATPSAPAGTSQPEPRPSDTAPGSTDTSDFKVVSAYHHHTAIRTVEETQVSNDPFSVAFVDAGHAPDWRGFETAQQLWIEDPNIQVVICVDGPSDGWASHLEPFGVEDRLLILKRPFDHLEVLQAARALSAKWDMTRQAALKVTRLEQVRRERYREVREAKGQLETSTQRFNRLVIGFPGIVYVLELGRDGRPLPVYVSPQIEAIIGVSVDEWEADPSGWVNLVPLEDRPRVLGSVTASSEGRPGSDFRVVTGDGRTVWLRPQQSVFVEKGRRYMHGILLDVSAVKEAEAEQAHLEAELRHSQKLEAVGQLAAGIAHEINTPIQYVGDNITFLRDAFASFAQLVAEFEYLTSPEAGALSWDERRRRQAAALAAADADYLSAEVPTAARQAAEGVERVATIVRAMKAFGHPGSEKKEPADLNDAIQTTLTVAANQIKYVADVQTDLHELPPVLCHVGDINQVLLNLVVNAAHAIGAVDPTGASRGTITVRSRSGGDHVVIEVSDTGTGIPPEIAGRVFDPFFTTKEIGVGTGQGLALAHSLIHERHHGSITFESEVGVGTTFALRLPLSSDHEPNAREHEQIADQPDEAACA